MGGRGSATGVAALAALALLAPGASARAGTVVVHAHVIAGSAASVLYTDGSAWAAYEPDEGVTRVIGPHRRITREDPRDCLLDAGPRAVHLVAAGAAKLLYQCEGPAIEADDLRSYQYVVVDAATGAEHLVAAPVEPPSRYFLSNGNPPTSSTLDAIGAKWAAGCVCGYHVEVPFYIAWRTGRYLQFPWMDFLPSLAQERYLRRIGPIADDLDSPGPLRRMCHPLQNSRQGDFAGPQRRYAPPFAYSEEGERLLLEHCGTHARASLGRSQAATVQLGGGLLSWACRNGTYACVTQLGGPAFPWHGTSWVFPLPPSEYLAGANSVQHAGTTLYASRVNPSGTYTIAAGSFARSS